MLQLNPLMVILALTAIILQSKQQQQQQPEHLLFKRFQSLHNFGKTFKREELK